ncbi:MAG TPA: hypothetical protein DC047_08445 [Blastocatellia bacterium]|nr:hypothetical protein [Blastocatellia bacterium]
MKLNADIANQSDGGQWSPGFLLQRKCDCGNHAMSGSCDDCAKKKGTLQRKSSSGFESSAAPSIVHEVLRSNGQPLDTATRGFMEPRFGHDFSQVRVHTDEKAADSARAVDSLAYTVGRNIVFAAGQYRPATAAGRRLVGHELTHVVQQGRTGATNLSSSRLEIDNPRDTAEQEAESVASRLTDTQSIRPVISAAASLQGAPAGVIQRTPAAPTYGGVTGTRDLSKLRIDPVPDLDQSKFVAPLDVHAHVVDPAIVHFTWMLYDPTDNMIAGFSTLPGKPTSTTMVFTLKPSHFAGAGFIEGKYILRLSGLNAKHQPIVYADRDITVVKADLTTGTALPTTYGKLTFTKYMSTDANPPGTPNYVVDVELTFLPDNKVVCDDVTYIQALESLDDTGKSQHRFSSAEKEARQTPLAWSIDQLAGVPSPYYIMSPDPKTGAIVDIAGYGKAGKGGAAPKPATLSDAPQWNKATHDKFETCAMCRSGINKGQVYGCATWGFTVNTKGKVTLQPRSFHQTPSNQFKEATDAWNTWRTSMAAAKRPDEVPVLKKP